MKVSAFMAKQYANPTGLFGRLVTSRLLNKANRQANDAVFEHLNLAADSNVLEVGFGGGDLLLRIAEIAENGFVAGLDSSDAMVARCAARLSRVGLAPSTQVQIGSVESLPYEDKIFDRVCSVNAIYFWPRLDDCLAELYRVVQPGGILVLGFGSGQRLKSLGYEQHGFRFYSQHEIQAALENQGFKSDRETVLKRPGRDNFNVLRYIRK